MNLNYRLLLLPILIVLITVFLNFARFDGSLIRAGFHISLQSIFIWSVFVFLQKPISLRIIFALLISIELFSRLAYNTSLSIGIVMSLFATSPNEALSFIKFNTFAILLSLLSLIGMISFKTPKRKLSYTLLMFFGIAYVLFPTAMSIQDLVANEKYSNYLHTGTARGHSQNFTQAEYLVQQNISLRFPPLKSIKGVTDTYQLLSQQFESSSTWTNANSEHASTDILVLGIGESLRADNMSVYGYERNTTPFQEKLRDSGQLTFYPDSYAAGTNTWSAIPASLTKVSGGTPDLTKSIIHLAKDAGYTTYWISNHKKLSHWDFSVSSIAAQTNHTHFLSKKEAGFAYDYDLVTKLSEILESKNEKSKVLIVLHFYGSHMTFADRYPAEYAHFNSDNKLLDQYDNSVLYSDYVQNETLKVVSKFGGNYLFFADHGLADPTSSIPLKHDIRDDPNLNSLKVPLITSSTAPLKFSPGKPIPLYYFECIFSAWSGISASELTDNNYCEKSLDTDVINFVDSNLHLHSKSI